MYYMHDLINGLNLMKQFVNNYYQILLSFSANIFYKIKTHKNKSHIKIQVLKSRITNL